MPNQNPEALHDVLKTRNVESPTITNNNVAQSPVVSIDQMTKAQVGDGATAKIRGSVNWNGGGAPNNSRN